MTLEKVFSIRVKKNGELASLESETGGVDRVHNV
ncbi:hypothetical protein SAG0109_02340 [Streptococcus agalactiae BSU108]|nr:hypothetical protein SAG0109_02340 [Streptococcus agalactiae BSU108]EPW72771.1 hypothetical protein SAG0101_04845 [Streptococcus agalactiae BSU451]EPW91363.1 hypothetical protein SAG0141_01895 [Streptococcus agalactiae MRI Z1-023]